MSDLNKIIELVNNLDNQGKFKDADEITSELIKISSNNNSVRVASWFKNILKNPLIQQYFSKQLANQQKAPQQQVGQATELPKLQSTIQTQLPTVTTSIPTSVPVSNRAFGLLGQQPTVTTPIASLGNLARNFRMVGNQDLNYFLQQATNPQMNKPQLVQQINASNLTPIQKQQLLQRIG